MSSTDSLSSVVARFAERAPAVDFWSLRVAETRRQDLCVRKGVVEPPAAISSLGAMVTVADGGGIGYAATCDLGSRGLAEAGEQARDWARRSGGCALIDPDLVPRPIGEHRHEEYPAQPWAEVPLGERIGLVREADATLGAAAGARRSDVVDWHAALSHWQRETFLATGDGARIEQRAEYLSPGLAAVASRGPVTQRRSHGNGDLARRGGLEQLDEVGFVTEATRVTEEALALLDARECPTDTRDVLLMPGQMILQLHESIGHPLELDRILGDERNYAGGSFVTLDMFGHYRYGSELLDVTFDPDVDSELGSYAFDDEGTRAERRYLIRRGVLERPLGGATSQARAAFDGVATARASDWNRPPIDRMANLNIEPGGSTLAAMIGGIERGVLMDTNRSWSIDHMRNKFQFGCEYARLIEGGELGPLVRNPNYRGMSATFWRSLAAVGDRDTWAIMGTPYCGKGEPNQIATVGHAAPACVFRAVDVFGGAGS